jgi:predicted PurR-regulated permease PerM
MVGLTTFILSFIFNIPNAGFLGLLAGITDFIPYLGVVITSIPMLILAFSSHGTWGIITAILILTITNQLEMWIYAPRISQQQVNINWFVILISMMILGQLYSIVGVLITVPLLIMIRNLWDMFVIPYLKNN